MPGSSSRQPSLGLIGLPLLHRSQHMLSLAFLGARSGLAKCQLRHQCNVYTTFLEADDSTRVRKQYMSWHGQSLCLKP